MTFAQSQTSGVSATNASTNSWVVQLRVLFLLAVFLIVKLPGFVSINH